MIITTLEQFGRYFPLNPHFEAVANWLKTTDLSALPTGRNEIDGENIYANVAEVAMSPDRLIPMEQHKAYIDIHVPLRLAENMGWSAEDLCTTIRQSYDAGGDYLLWEDTPAVTLPMPVGTLTIVFPEDPHSPLVGEGFQRKIIIKVKNVM
ncbi:MAG: YhcH/YjgK/YiaL family protein [Porphyromonas sp.]|nr:YhcH/YjgK/YiaL family protein [Porphyromonas sp.]